MASRFAYENSDEFEYREPTEEEAREAEERARELGLDEGAG